MSFQKLGFALRPGVFTPDEIKKTAVVLDRTGIVSRIFIPDGRIGYESLEIASSILASTNRVTAGSGVIRLLEHDPMLLVRRVQTLQGFSNNRFFLGIGTGSPGSQPSRSIVAMLQKLDELKKGFQGFPQGVQPPDIFVAALKSGIAKRSVGRAAGLLFNFCSPRHAASLIGAIEAQKVRDIEFACYLKVFYSSKNDPTAQRLMLQEFLNYDSAPQYHEMFLQDGTANAIQRLKENDAWKSEPVEVPEELLKVSLANPTSEALHRYVQSFRKAGVTLPVVYPYFPDGERAEFKLETVKRMQTSL